MSLFNREIVNGKKQVPVWFMRQAGRYHQHYQEIRKEYTFDQLCKTPHIAAKATMGPIEDFDFDASILFSDLLYPLEQIGLGLSYDSGKPTLEKQLLTLDDVKNIKLKEDGRNFYSFQKEACILLREQLPKSKNLIGFVGAPFTLFSYAVYGTHMGSLVKAKTGLYDGRFALFSEILIPEILKEMDLQVEGGADTISIFDTAVGELSLCDFEEFIVPTLRQITSKFKAKHPDHKIIYYSKFTSLNHLQLIDDPNIDVLGVDYRHDLVEVMEALSDKYIIQGNIDPCWLHLKYEQLEVKLDQLFTKVLNSKINLDRWICGLGHGVLPETPEENVRKAVSYIHERLRY